MISRLTTGAVTAILLFAGQVQAQEGDTSPSLSIELNGLQASERGCLLTFVAANQAGQDIARATYEVALFGDDGLVKRLTVLDFKELPDGETKVRQFDLPDVECASLGRILVNGTTACDGAEDGLCMGGLKTATRSPVTFGK